MSYPFEDNTVLKHNEETKEQSPEELIYQHDIAIKQLEARLNSLENLVNHIHNLAPVWWGQQ